MDRSPFEVREAMLECRGFPFDFIICVSDSAVGARPEIA
jgi:hypothetical protein